MSESEQRFLDMVHDPDLRQALLERLAQLGLLAAFLEIESETIPAA